MILYHIYYQNKIMDLYGWVTQAHLKICLTFTPFNTTKQKVLDSHHQDF